MARAAALTAVALFAAGEGSHALAEETAADDARDVAPRFRPLFHVPVSEAPPWDRHERTLMWTYASLGAIDAYQTIQQPDGFRESNPVLASWAGDRPSAGEIVAFKAVTTYGLIRLADRYGTTHRKRKTALWLINAFQLSIDIRNERITGGILFHHD